MEEVGVNFWRGFRIYVVAYIVRIGNRYNIAAAYPDDVQRHLTEIGGSVEGTCCFTWGLELPTSAVVLAPDCREKILKAGCIKSRRSNFLGQD